MDEKLFSIPRGAQPFAKSKGTLQMQVSEKGR